MSIYTEAIDNKVREIEKAQHLYSVLLTLPQLGNLSGRSYINAYGTDSIWINVYDRDDLTTAMSCIEGKPWIKTTSGGSMVYTNRTDDIEIKIYATEAALPPTCKITQEVVHHPAREAYTETVTKITCDV